LALESGLKLAEVADAFSGTARLDAPLASYSRAGIGGPADLLIVAKSRDELIEAVRLVASAGVPWRIYGGLTNILLPDSGLRGAVILNQARHVSFDERLLRVEAESGAVVIQVAREAVRRGWGGLTWAVGLPGTIGGAVVNNAGAFGGEVADTLLSAEIVDADGEVCRVSADWFDFRYRCSKLKGAGAQWIVLNAVFQLKARDRSNLEAKASEYTARRRRTQPPGLTLGSTFKNPPDDYAGRLIEAAGLKGTRRGEVVVSHHHANFLINEGEGSAADFRALIEHVRETVAREFDVWLEPEIEILSEEPRVALRNTMRWLEKE
jgi:UDP-N-acetylmuramate dehydrogenase